MSKLLIDAALGKKTSKIPLWLMRQAGRYLPEYREFRQKYDTLTMFKTPKIASEITLQPLKRFELSGAILYADILLIPDALGMGLFFVEKEGPKFKKTIRSESNYLDMLKIFENVDSTIQKLCYVGETIQLIKKQLDNNTTLLGFAGAPFTVASYMIEGGSSKGDFIECKKFIYNEPKTFHRLMESLTEITIAYLKMQVDAGAEVVQLFESWSGALTPAQYREFCLPYSKKIVSALKPLVPTIHFLGQGASLLSEAKEINSHVVSVDWRQDLSAVSKYFSDSNIALQGNLDPLVLYAPKPTIKKEVEKCLRIGSEYSNGYIFNLGHGCTQHTPVENVEYLVKLVLDFKN